MLPELPDLFVRILLLAQAAGVLPLGNISVEGRKIHADASKSHAVSAKRLLAWEQPLQQEVAELFVLSAQAGPPGMSVPEELARRQDRLARLAEA